MSIKGSVTFGVGLVLAIVAVAVVGAAIFLTDKGEEIGHLYSSFNKNNGPGVASAGTGAMELHGKWRGMLVAAIDGPSAQRLGLREADRGVIVTQVLPGATLAAGVKPGDVVTAVDQTPVRDLADLYKASRGSNPYAPVMLNVKRGEQAVALVVPSAVTQAAAGQQGVANVQAPGAPMAPGTLTPTQPPAGWGPAQQVAWPGRNFYCPRDGTVLPANAVPGGQVCPRCQGPLHVYPPTPR